MFDGVERLKKHFEQHELGIMLAKTGLVILYGDEVSNKLQPGEKRGKFKVCAVTGNKGTVKVLLEEAMKQING